MFGKQGRGADEKQNQDDIKTVRIITRDVDLAQEDINDVKKRLKELKEIDISSVKKAVATLDLSAIVKVGTDELVKLVTPVEKERD